jgi:type I restriction enzyme S subunit
VSEYGVRVRDLEAGGRALGQDLDEYRRVHIGDLVVNRLWARFGAYGVSEFDGLISPAYWVLKPDASKVDGRFLHSLLRSSTYLAEIRRLSKDMPPNGFDLPWDLFKRIVLDLPSLASQREIANCIDDETARIDALIEKKQNITKLTQEKLDNTAKEFFPHQSQDRSLRRHLLAIQTGTTPAQHLFAENETESTIPWYTPGDFGKKLELKMPEKFIQSDLLKGGNVRVFPAGAVLVIGIGATTGQVAIADRMGSSNQQITALSPACDLSSRYLAWQLWARRGEVLATAPYSTLPIINNEFLKSLRVCVPDLSEQLRVVSHLDELASTVARIQDRTAIQLKTMLERRQAFVSALVTGELKVPGVAA